MRDGKVIGEFPNEEVTTKELDTGIAGREVETIINGRDKRDKEIVLKVENLNCYPIVKNVNFTAKKGEILGLWGLLGSGRTEIIRNILGLDKPDTGNVYKRNNKGTWKKSADISYWKSVHMLQKTDIWMDCLCKCRFGKIFRWRI